MATRKKTPAKAKTTPKRGKGRPTKYTPDMADRGYKLALLGFTNEKLAIAFGVNVSTIEMWMRTHEDFSRDVLRGKEEADSDVANALFKKAVGYDQPDEKIFQYEGEVIRAKTKKHYPPDAGAAMNWLKNRQPEHWRDRQEVEHSGAVSRPSMDIEDLDLPVETQRQILDALRAKKKASEEDG